MTVSWPATEPRNHEPDGRILPWPGPQAPGQEDVRVIAHQESKVIPFRPRRSAPSVGRSLALEMSAALLAVVLLNMAIVLIYSGAM